MTITVAEVDALAAAAHAGQVDKIGVPYIEHPRAVARGLEPFGEELVMAGLLHDTLEDSSLTSVALIRAGVPPLVCGIVLDVTSEPHGSYVLTIRRIARNRNACLVKLAENAHNARPDRLAKLRKATRDRLAAKYQAARADLFAGAVPPEDIAIILERVNPALLTELHLATVCGDCESGRCHWGGERSHASEAAVKAGHQGGRCGCARHEISVRARQWQIEW